MKTSQSTGLPRREFIKRTATAAAAVATTSTVLKNTVYGQAPSSGRTIGANDRIGVAVIGTGMGIGMNHFMGIQDKAGANNVSLLAGSDLADERRKWMRGELELYGGKVKEGLADKDVVNDYRKILDRKDIDAVVIATHDPWHAQITMDAISAGKHVYCEKPMTRYLDEAFKVYDAVKKSGKVFQIGSQGCSAGAWQKAAEMIKAGKVGTLVWGQGFYCRNNVGGEWNYDLDEGTANPASVDWERWLGPVKTRTAYSQEHFHRWRKYTRYCAGLLGDLAPHRLHPLMLASGTPEYPVRVTSIATRNIHEDTEKPAPEREVPEHVTLIAEFPSGYQITVACSTVNEKSPGFEIHSHKATLMIGNSGDRIDLLPEKKYADEVDPESLTGLQVEDIRVHEKDWFDTIRGNKPQTNGNIELAIRVQTVISLAEMSDRLRTTCMFDEKTRKISDGSGKEIAPITYGVLPLS